jgi:hypothetical protein
MLTSDKNLVVNDWSDKVRKRGYKGACFLRDSCRMHEVDAKVAHNVSRIG